jgi:hypothetical protein
MQPRARIPDWLVIVSPGSVPIGNFSDQPDAATDDVLTSVRCRSTSSSNVNLEVSSRN